MRDATPLTTVGVPRRSPASESCVPRAGEHRGSAHGARRPSAGPRRTLRPTTRSTTRAWARACLGAAGAKTMATGTYSRMRSIRPRTGRAVRMCIHSTLTPRASALAAARCSEARTSRSPSQGPSRAEPRTIMDRSVESTRTSTRAPLAASLTASAAVCSSAGARKSDTSTTGPSAWSASDRSSPPRVSPDRESGAVLMLLLRPQLPPQLHARARRISRLIQRREGAEARVLQLSRMLPRVRPAAC